MEVRLQHVGGGARLAGRRERRGPDVFRALMAGMAHMQLAEAPLRSLPFRRVRARFLLPA